MFGDNSVIKRYRGDPMFRALVDMFEGLLNEAKFTPTEIREAAMLAQIRFESMHIRPQIIPLRDVDTQ